MLNEVFGDGRGCAKGPQAQGCCWVKPLFLSDRTGFSLGWRRNLKVIGMCLSSQSKTNIKISASISSHVTGNKGRELDWMPFSEGQTHKEGFLGG